MGGSDFLDDALYGNQVSSSDMGLSQFDIVLPAGGESARIVIDGVDLANQVTRVKIDADSSDRIPRVSLEMRGEGHIKGEGVVEFAKPDRDQRELMVEFLDNLDPDEVEKDVLGACGGLNGPSTGEAFLAVLKGYVRGDDDGT